MNSKQKYSVVFFGTPDFSVPTLKLLTNNPELEIILVVTQSDQPSGRGKKIIASPIKQLAHDLKLKISTDLKTATTEIIDLKPDLGIVVAYGEFLPEKLLNAFKFGCLNIHPSLLPLYRGPAPIPACILNGDAETGVSIMKLDKEMDHGPIIVQEKFKLTGTETTATLLDKLSIVGGELLIKTLPLYLAGKITPQEQNHNLATFTELLKKEDGKLDLSQPAEKLARQIRSVLPWPSAETEITIKNKVVKLKVLQAEAITLENNKKTASEWLVENNQLIIVCGNNSGLNLKLLQPLGKNPQSARDFINGYLK